MPFELKGGSDKQLLHRNDITVSDFNTSQLLEDTSELSFPFANAKMSHWQFDGIRMIHTNWQYKERSEITWKADMDIIHLQFNLKGEFSMKPLHGHLPMHFKENQHNMHFTHKAAGVIKNEELVSSQFILQFSKESFLQLAENSDDALQRFAEKVIKGDAAALSEDNLPMGIQLQQAINAIIHCSYQGGIKKMFLFSKAIEILVLQMESFHQAASKTKRIVRTAYDREQLHFAKDYLQQNLENPPTLPALAKMAGLNEYKLKHGFKELFNTTAFGFVAEQRLELARLYLLDKQKSVGDIADMLGYSSIQHFSLAFKKKFGCSPNKAR